MLRVQYQSGLFWVGALLNWSCAHLLASKLFMKQILKRRLSPRPSLIWLESRIDRVFLSLSLSPCSLKIQTNFFLSVSPQLQTQSDMERNAKTDLKKTPIFTFILLLIDCLCQLCICILKKGVPELFRQGQFTDFGNVPGLFHASVLGNVVTV